MLRNLLLFTFLFSQAFLFAQSEENLPAYLTEKEEEMLEWYDVHTFEEKGITTPPPGPVRTMAEWEEIQALCVTWTQFRPTVAEIIRHAKEETEVIVLTTNPAAAEAQLLNTYDLPDLNNVTFLDVGFNSIWMRDYGPNTVYTNDVDSLAIVDWIYNRPRPLDDVTPDAIGELVNVPVHTTTQAPTDLVNTGGNFMSDGMGTGFASELVIDENLPGNPFDVTPKTEEEIDAIMQEWQGIDRYIKMETLPYDLIHHIDMHMKLLDEETLLVGEYPPNEADGPQIEENLNYILDNFLTPYGNPYDVVRIQMPPHNGNYPDSWNSDYRTYTNSVFVNKTILVPVYEEQFDSTALNVYREALPGYNVVGIDCNQIIQAFGALHCITRAVGVEDPLLINHEEHHDEVDVFDDHEIKATIKHRSGISTAYVYWTLDPEAGYAQVEMELTDTETNEWTAYIPNQAGNGRVYYYIQGVAESGKVQVRPIVAPFGWYDFISETTVTSTSDVSLTEMSELAPNPTSTTASFTVNSSQALEADIDLFDVLGKNIQTVFTGRLNAGETRFSIDATTLSSGIYFVKVNMADRELTRKLVVK